MQHGQSVNLGRFAELGRKGVLALMCDSTNAQRPGFTVSEKLVACTFEALFGEYAGNRLIIATFASNVDRVNQIIQTGAKIIYQDTHVSGHACQEERKLIYSLVRPRYAIPVHGEYRHLAAQAGLAETMGLPKENIFILQSGDILELSEEKACISGKAETGYICDVKKELRLPVIPLLPAYSLMQEPVYDEVSPDEDR